MQQEILCFQQRTGNIMPAMIDLLRRLIAANSTSQVGELQAARILAEAVSRCGMTCQIDEWPPNHANVVAQLPSTGQRQGILFLTHLDVVGADARNWQTPPFEAVERDGRIYGRGAVDMKGGIAAAVEAVRRLSTDNVRLNGDVYLAGMAGEETDSAGIERFVSQIPKLGPLAGVVICEPTALKVATAHRGILWLRITTHGKAGHSAMPHGGVNAIESMLTLLRRIRAAGLASVQHATLGAGSVSVNMISGGIATNIIPDTCQADIDIRVVPGNSTVAVLEQVNRLLAELHKSVPDFRAQIQVTKRAEPLETDDKCDFVRDLCRAAGIADTTSVGFTTDGPWLTPLCLPIVVLGPGNPELCHQENEYIETSDLIRAADMYEQIMRHFLI
jgi:succinyl-diaminopimelate desuccinylase